MRNWILKIALSLFLSVFSSVVFGHEPDRIIIKDKITLLPIEGAILTTKDGSLTVISDENGSITYALDIPTVISITSLGYTTKTMRSDTIPKVVFLSPTKIHLKEFQVVSHKNEQTFESLSKLDIDLNPIRNSQEILQMVSGLYIGQHAGGGKAEQIFIRGFDSDHGTDIALSVDGMPVNMVSHAHGQGYADLHFVIPEMVEKVDFDKGSYFADKGNFNTAGYVDFKTRDYLDKSFVKLEGGQFNTGRVVTGLNILNPKTDNGQSLIFASEISYSDGYFEYPQNFSRFNGLMNYTLPLNNSVLRLSASGFTSEWLASGQIPNRAVENGTIGWFGAIDPNEGGNTSRVNANAQLTTYLENGATLKNQIYYTNYQFELYSNFTFYLEDQVNGDEIKQKESRNLVGYNGEYDQFHQWGNIPVHTQFGLTARQDFIDDIELSHTVNRELLERLQYGDIEETNIAVYAKQDYKFTSKLTVTLGLRGDYFINTYANHLSDETLTAEANAISPKLNFTYTFNNRLKLYLYNGKGFHSNDTRIVVQQNGKDILPAAYSNDLGVIVKPAKNLVLQAAVWRLWLDQEFVYVGDAGVVEPSGRTQRMGVDLSARFEPIPNWFIHVDANYAHPRSVDDPEGENYIPLAPIFTGLGGITYASPKGFNGSLRCRYMGDRPANEDNSIVAEGYFITDLVLNYTRPKWELGIGVLNLFDTKWKETQFATESQLQNETAAVEEIHFTPGTPFSLNGRVTFYF